MSVDRIHRLIESAPALGEDGEWLAAALRRYVDEAQHGLTMVQALGVATPRGGTPWWKIYALRRRDDAISRLRDLLPVDSYRSQALAIRAAAIRFKRTRWHSLTEAPSDPVLRELNSLLAATGGKPPSRKAIDRALWNRDMK